MLSLLAGALLDYSLVVLADRKPLVFVSLVVVAATLLFDFVLLGLPAVNALALVRDLDTSVLGLAWVEVVLAVDSAYIVLFGAAVIGLGRLAKAIVTELSVRLASKETAVQELNIVLRTHRLVLAVARLQTHSLQRRVTRLVISDFDAGTGSSAFI